MKKTKRIYVVRDSIEYASWIDNKELVDSIDKADIVLFTGGEDVDPSMYGCEKHYKTYSNLYRDRQEQKVFKHIRKDQLAIGICRGLII